MSMFNNINIIGNIVKDPTMGTGDKEWAIARLACNTGKKETPETLFIDIKLFGGAYRDLKNFDIKKGDKVSVNGTLKSSDYEDKNGVKRTSYAIYADYVLKLSRRIGGDDAAEASEPSDQAGEEVDASPF